MCIFRGSKVQDMLLLQVENERATRLRRSRLRELNSLPAFLPAEGPEAVLLQAGLH